MELEIAELRQLYEDANGKPSQLRPLEPRFDALLDAAPNHAEALTLLAQVQLELGKMDESLATSERCAAVSPNAASCWLTIAVIQETRGNREPAVEGYQAYARLAPEGRYIRDVHKALRRLDAAPPGPSSVEASVQAHVNAHRSELQSCYTQGERPTPSFSITIGAAGDVTGVSVIDDSGQSDGPTARCVMGIVAGWTFRTTPEGAEVPVNLEPAKD